MGEIVQLKKTRLPRSRDAFYQAIPVNEIQGRFFYFGRNKLPDDVLFKREKEKAQSIISGVPDDRNFEIIHNPVYGVPGPLAYRLWTGIEKVLSDSGSDFDGRLKLSMRQLAKLAGRSVAGKTADEISVAVRQLESAVIHYWYEDTEDKNEDGSPKVREEKFSLFEKVSFVREDHKSAPHYYIITVPEIILGFLFHDRYFFCMSWERVKNLSPQSQSVARILYRYMSYRYSKAKTINFAYKKDYATMCQEWFGGVTPYTKLSEAKRKHIATRFNPIVESGLLSSYEVVANKDKTGFNILVEPGKEFFADFESFYKKQLPLNFGEFKTARDAHLGNPQKNIQDGAFALVGYFHEQFFGDEAAKDYIEAEIKFAQSLLSKLPLDDAKKFIDWAITQARATNFKMQTINAIDQYQSKWESERKREGDRLQKMEAIRSRDEEEANKKLYADFCQTEAQRFLDELTDDERSDLRIEAERQLHLQLPDTKKFFAGHVLSVERRLVLESHNLPDYDTWKTSC